MASRKGKTIILLRLLNFCSKTIVFSKKNKQRSSPLVKFFLHFSKMILVIALKFLILLKFFLSLPKNSGFAQIFPCRCPKNCDFAQIFETLFPCSPAGMAMNIPLCLKKILK